MKILELEETYRRLRDELIEARCCISRIAADQNSSPEQVREARDRADAIKGLATAARIDFARALFADGVPVVQIAGRLGTVLACVKDMLAIGGD